MVGTRLLSEEPSEEHRFVFRLGNLTGLFKKLRGFEQRWPQETMNPLRTQALATNNRLSNLSHRGPDTDSVLPIPCAPDFMA